MIVLNSTTRSLEAVLGSSIGTQLPVVTSYVDFSATETTPTLTATQTNNTTAVTIVPAPAAEHTRQIKSLFIRGSAATPVTVTVRLNDNGTFRVLFSTFLGQNETLFYESGNGFFLIDSDGRIKSGLKGDKGDQGDPGEIPEAPHDGISYVRRDSDWHAQSQNLSEYTNDLSWITLEDIPDETDPLFTAWLATPPNISEFANDEGFITAADIPFIGTIPATLDILVGDNGGNASASGFTFPLDASNTSQVINAAALPVAISSLGDSSSNISQWTNDSGYLTQGGLTTAVDYVYWDGSQLQPGAFSGVNLSVLNNDAGFITDATADSGFYSRQNNAWTVPTLTSFSNDAGFITAADIPPDPNPNIPDAPPSGVAKYVLYDDGLGPPEWLSLSSVGLSEFSNDPGFIANLSEALAASAITPVTDGEYFFDATTPGSVTSLTFTSGIATAISTL